MRTVLLAGSGSEALEKILQKRQGYIESTLRRKVEVKDYDGGELLSSRAFDVHGQSLLVKFCKS